MDCQKASRWGRILFAASVRGCTAHSAWKVGCSTEWHEAMFTLLLKAPVSTAGSTSGLWDGIQAPWSGLLGACGHWAAPAHVSTPCYVSLRLEQGGRFTSASVGMLPGSVSAITRHSLDLTVSVMASKNIIYPFALSDYCFHNLFCIKLKADSCKWFFSPFSHDKEGTCHCFCPICISLQTKIEGEFDKKLKQLSYLVVSHCLLQILPRGVQMTENASWKNTPMFKYFVAVCNSAIARNQVLTTSSYFVYLSFG